MTDDELKALCESNARSVQANSSAIADLGRGMVQFREDSAAFRNELRSWVEIHNQISDDQGAELADLRTGSNTHDAQVTALREAANADRQAFISQMNADRERSDQRFEAARRESDQRFEAARRESDQRLSAQQEVLQRMLLELRSTNGVVTGLSDRVDGLEQAS